jgi:phosphohistidine phosphatase
VPEEVLCSAAARTRETLDLMRPAWDPAPRVAYEEALYLAEPARMLQVLAGASARVVAMVGHNPGTGALAAALAAEPPDHPRWGEVPTCAVAVIDFEAESWATIGQGTLVAFRIPADLL